MSNPFRLEEAEVIFGACMCSDDRRRHRCNAVVGIRTLERKIFCATREALKIPGSSASPATLWPASLASNRRRRFHDREGLACTFPLHHPRALPPPNKRLRACWQGSKTFSHPPSSIRPHSVKHGSDGHALADDGAAGPANARSSRLCRGPWPGRQRPCPFCTGVLVPFCGFMLIMGS
jgi:hypothetical protein